MNDVLWRVALIDGLLLCLIVATGLWFRAWLARERQEMQQQMASLEEHWQRLQQVSDRLEVLGRTLEMLGQRRAEELEPKPEPLPHGEVDDIYSRAWSRLDKGVPAAAVAKEFGLGVAEVELMGRMMRMRRRSSTTR